MIKKAVIRYPEYKFQAKIVRWLDGDTAELIIYLGSRFDKIDLGFDFTHVIADEFKSIFRLFGINAPEKYKEGGPESWAYARFLVPEGIEVVVMTSKEPDKYGRYVAEIYLDEGGTFGETMIAAGYAEVYAEKRSLTG